ncbi:MAG: diguanylate cyclase, partial [Deltaproteobacteria bacterium]|nr:diguanylate cyclase [Deltaproteobacteria bacterium]
MFDNSGNEYLNYIKLNLNFDNDSEAERISNEIIEHKSFLDKSLGRDIGIEVALLDYITNINKAIHIPAVFDSVEISKIGHYFNPGNFSSKDKLKFYDTSILSKDINVEIERAYRYGSPFSILMFDLDIEYDPDLNKISVYMQNNISSHIRLTDNVYSYKKNCYVLLLPETNAEDAIHAAFNIRNWINDYRSRDGKEPLLICIGVAVYGLYEIDSDHKILSAADKALREAKSSEGERVCLYHGNTILNIKENVSKNIKVCKNCKHIQLTGISIHPGLALGTIFIYNDILSHELESYDISAENLETELERIVEAIHNVEKDLVDMEHLVSKDLSNEYSTIFQAHRLILKDNQVLDEIKKDLYEKKINGEEIVRNVFKRWEKRFLAFEDEIFKNKSQDIADISGRIIKELRGIDSHILESTPMDSILFANRLLPSDTVNLNKNNIKALVTKEGSRFSHTAILSKAMNIPLVILEDMDLSSFGHNEQVIVDGDKGEVTINPSEEEIEKAKKIVEKNKADASNNLFLDKKELFYKGDRVQILGAASNLDEAGETESYGGEGIGLFRMEVLYLSRNTLPDEETLINEIEKILEPCKDQEIVI